jgi:hypothetical protein
MALAVVQVWSPACRGWVRARRSASSCWRACGVAEQGAPGIARRRASPALQGQGPVRRRRSRRHPPHHPRHAHRRVHVGRPATGRRFEMEANHLYRIENGRVAEHWAKRDDVALAHQIGLFEWQNNPPAGRSPATSPQPAATRPAIR